MGYLEMAGSRREQSHFPCHTWAVWSGSAALGHFALGYARACALEPGFTQYNWVHAFFLFCKLPRFVLPSSAITLILDKLLPSYTRRQAHCRLCKHQNHVKCAVQTCKLVVQAQLLLCTTYLNVLALHWWDTPHCSEEWSGFSVTVNWILRQAKNTTVLHPRINASHDQHAYTEICK